MNCPKCQRQNVDTAKFCGNCGTAFHREDLVSSSLVNCGRGHIYSAVYDRCPYCPASELLEAPATEEKRRPSASDLGPWTRGTGDLTGGLVTSDVGTDTRTKENKAAAEVAIPADIPQLRLAEKPAQKPPQKSPQKPDAVESTGPADSAAEAIPPPPPAPPLQVSKSAPLLAARAPEESNSSDRRTVIISADDVKRSSERRLVGWLVTFSGHPEGKDFRLRSGVNRIGARNQCDIVIDDDAVSSSHALIVCRDGECSIRDDFSTNGTFVNGVRVQDTQKISSNDTIRVGNTEFSLILIAP